MANSGFIKLGGFKSRGYGRVSLHTLSSELFVTGWIEGKSHTIPFGDLTVSPSITMEIEEVGDGVFNIKEKQNGNILLEKELECSRVPYPFLGSNIVIPDFQSLLEMTPSVFVRYLSKG